MTRAEGMDLLDRYVHAGYRQPAEMAAAFDEWFAVFGGSSVEDVSEAIGRLIRSRSSSYWPTPGELAEHLRAIVGGRIQADSRCATCHGSGWVEAPPYRANGGLLYEGVRRCFDCGKPAPDLRHLEGHQTPMSASEVRDWARARSERGGPTTRAELAAEMAAIARRMTMPKAKAMDAVGQAIALPARAGEDE